MIQRLTQQKNRIARFFLATFLVVSLVLPLQQASANMFSDEVFDIPHTALGGVNTGSTVSNTATTIKDFVIKLAAQVLKAIAQVLLNKLTEATVNWINGGFKGAPKFVENPKSFFKNIGDTQLENLIDTIGYNASKFPYGREVSQALISSYRNQNSDIGSTMTYTLTNIVGQEANKFQKNFNVGGWAAYEAYNRNPANNAFGSLFLGADKAAKVVTDAQQKVQKEVDLGQGFLNQRTCVRWKTEPQVYGPQQQGQGTGFSMVQAPGTYTGLGQAQQAEHQFLSGGAKKDSDCLEWKTLSPGSLVQSQINLAAGSKFMQSQLGAALGNSLSNIINALTTSLLNKGIAALSTIGKDDNDDAGKVWSYDGMTLSGTGSTSSNGVDNWSQTPDKVIDLNQLLMVGVDFDVDEYGKPVKQTMIDLAQRQVDSYKRILDLLHGTPIQDSFAQVIRELDYTLPGPKFMWESRFNRKFSKILQKWQVKEGKGTKKKQEKTDNLINLLLDRQDSIPSAIRIRALQDTIPSYTMVQAQIKDAYRYSGKEKEYTEKYIDSLTVLSRLKNIKVKLDEIINNYTDPDSVVEIDPGINEYLASQGQEPVVPNPLLSLTGEGNKQLTLLIKEYSQLSGDIPNSYTVQDAENSLTKIKFEYDNVLKTIAQVREEVADARPQQIYKAHIKDRFIKSLTPMSPAMLPPNAYQEVITHGYYDPEAQAAAAMQGLNIAGSVITTILTFGMSAPISATTGAVTGLMIANREHDVFINAFGGGEVPEECELNAIGCDPSINPNANLAEETTGLELVHIVTDVTVDAMKAALLADPYFSDTLDEDRKDTYDALSDENITLLYSIVMSTNELHLTDEWDPLATGRAKFEQAILFMEDYDSTDPNYKPSKTDGERMYFCQSIMDKMDTREGRGAYKSLFRKNKFNCADFYESNVVDYRTP